MKLILTHEVSGLGTPGDVVDVKDGYARNYLIPRSLATAWTKGAEKQVASIRKGREVRAVNSLEEAKQVRGRLESQTVVVTVRSGASGRLFGAVTTSEIAAAVQASGGPAIDRRTIEVHTPIKTTGSHEALVRLHPEVQAKITLEVVPG